MGMMTQPGSFVSSGLLDTLATLLLGDSSGILCQFLHFLLCLLLRLLLATFFDGSLAGFLTVFALLDDLVQV
ncbi:hypothetical protein F5883DRAFT_585110 [Diaporthe sp. PMI_573]|nr:hypothetical protein F5883DRAFT_585110 [Diaporthaceae sp. PMI_573]